MAGALDLRVLDLTSGIAGPVAGMWLADFGADVVKVEGPDGDPARGERGFAMWNRNKRSVVFEPGDGQADWLSQMLLGADVLLLSDRADLSGLGHDLSDVVTANRRLVVAELPAYLAGFTPWAGGRESPELLASIGGQLGVRTLRTADRSTLLTRPLPTCTGPGPLSACSLRSSSERGPMRARL